MSVMPGELVHHEETADVEYAVEPAEPYQPRHSNGRVLRFPNLGYIGRHRRPRRDNEEAD